MARKKQPRTRRKKDSFARDFVLPLWFRVRLPLLLIALALIPRLLALFDLSDSPIYLHPVIDSQTYHEMAAQIAAGDVIGHSTFWQAPLYPYFLGVLYWLFGVSITAAKLVQVLISAVNCYLIFRLAAKVLDRRVAWLAFGIAAIYGPFIFFATELLAPVLLNFLILLAINILISYKASSRPLKTILVGFILGLAQIGHGLIAAFIPLLIVWLFYFHYRGNNRLLPGLKSSGFLLIGFLSLVAVTTVRNYAVDHELTLVSANVGANFYLGNHPNYDSTTAIRPGLEWDECIQEAAVHGQATPAQSSAYFTSKAIDNLGDDPLAFLGLLAKKAYLLTAGEEIKRNLDIYHFKRYSTVLDVLIWRHVIAFPTGIILPLALCWMIFFIFKPPDVQSREVWLLLAFVFSQAAAILLFFVSSRYRLTIMPMAIIFASALIIQLVAPLRSGKSGKIAVQVGLIVVLLLSCNIPRIEQSPKDEAENLFYEGLAFAQGGDCDTAINLYRAAVDLNHNYAMAEYNMALCYGITQQINLAEQSLDSVVARNPKSFMAKLVVGKAQLDMGNREKAEELFGKVLQMNPNSVEARINLGEIFRLKMDSTQALQYLRSAIAIDPKAYKAYNQMGAVYMENNMMNEAERCFYTSFQLNGSYAKALINLGSVYGTTGRMHEAERCFERAVEIDPNDITGLLNYGAVMLKQAEPAAALELFNRAVMIAPETPQTHHYRGVALLSLRQTPEAKRSFQRALKLDPDFAPARQQLEKMGANQ
ncbi:MAG: tetratricopeptide repeat protein [candidate division Zixibacteria bacterium]|nr:tetratricopeptide repeat protein [candidate division Zixibacteria bacterium]MBU1470377.1 tetratricopeptide repeat protein [candidate division Zixibacteria bacterium]MBU2624895.1 tetratricopeptide repeat protein [candidate division Zixibacteria bacterium]